MADDQLIATIEKSATTELRVQIREYRGTTFVDIRTYATSDATGKAPTHKGVTVPPDKLGELIEALHEAEARAQAAGLIPASEAGE